MSKLLVALAVVGLAAVARCDEQYHSTAPQYYQPQQTSSYSNYQQSGPEYNGGYVDGIFDSNRRQFGLFGLGGLGGLGGLAGPLIGLVLIFVVAIGLFAAAAFISTTSSGRGLDTDEWEVDHSVWMNQLQQDFENSWDIE